MYKQASYFKKYLSVNRLIVCRNGVTKIWTRKFYDFESALEYSSKFPTLRIFNENYDCLYQKENNIVVIDNIPRKIKKNNVLLVDFGLGFDFNA